MTSGKIYQIHEPLAPIRRAARVDAPLDTQAFFGERAEFLNSENDWVKVRLLADNYIGFMPSAMLSRNIYEPTHRVIVPRSFVFPKANLKTPPINALIMGAQVKVDEESEGYAQLSTGGYIFAQHLRPADFRFPDFVSVAEHFLHAPYLWGGKSILGIDCSGLVQLSLSMAGIEAPRDSGPQEKTLGEVLPEKLKYDDVKRGDLLCWKGHIALARGNGALIHATANFMQVVIEPIAVACERIAKQGIPLTSIRRL
jgi:cell wall-associated NlpC family hydrolase